MELQRLLEERRAIFVAKKLQDVGNSYENQLSEAVLNNKIKEVEELLLKHLDKIDMNKGVKGLPPLLIAAMMNRVEICRLLLENGCVDVNDESSRWRTTPLRLAVKAGHVKVVKLLLDFGKTVFLTKLYCITSTLDHVYNEFRYKALDCNEQNSLYQNHFVRCNWDPIFT